MNARELRSLGRAVARLRSLEDEVAELAERTATLYTRSAADWKARRAGDAGVAHEVAQLRGKWLRMAAAAERGFDRPRAAHFRALAQELDAALAKARPRRKD